MICSRQAMICSVPQVVSIHPYGSFTHRKGFCVRTRDHFKGSFTIQVLNCKGMSHSIKMRVDDMAKLIAGAGHQLRNLQVFFPGPFSYLYVSFIGLFMGVIHM